MTLKHLILTAAALIAASTALSAQDTGAPARGYRGFVDISLLPGTISESGAVWSCDYDRAGLLTTHGIQLNKRIFVGLGLGFETYIDDSLIDEFNVIVPIYGAFRCDFIPKRITPFAEARLGGFAGDYSGLFLNLGAGIRLRRFNFSIGYEMLQGSVDVQNDYGHIEPADLVSNNFVLRFGVDIGRRQ